MSSSSSREASITLTVVKTVDDFPIAATVFEPSRQERPKAVVVIANATGVHAKFYKDFATWLATNGVFVTTFDYRYTGLSFPPPFKPASFSPEEIFTALQACPDHVTMDTWSKKDLAAVIRFASDAHPKLPFVMLGHSLGGHMMSLCPEEWHRVTRFLNIGGGNAFYMNTREPEAARQAFGSIILQELNEHRVFRASLMGLGYDLPAGPGRVWYQWFLHPHFALMRKEDAEAVRKLVDKKYLYVGFEDDDVIPKNMMEAYLPMLPLADHQKHSLWIDPASKSPPWPHCKHVNTLMKTSPPKSKYEFKSTTTPSPDDATFVTREETVWRTVILPYILEGYVDTSGETGEYRLWTKEDERDLEKERAEHERSERARARKERKDRFWDVLGRVKGWARL